MVNSRRTPGASAHTAALVLEATHSFSIKVTVVPFTLVTQGGWLDFQGCTEEVGNFLRDLFTRHTGMSFIAASHSFSKNHFPALLPTLLRLDDDLHPRVGTTFSFERCFGGDSGTMSP